MDKEQQKHLVAVEMALLALGMPPNLKGFYYIKDAVWMLLQSGGHIGNKHIFERLTSRYGAPNSAIRKSMRTAIKVTFDRGNSKSKAKWFGSLIIVVIKSLLKTLLQGAFHSFFLHTKHLASQLSRYCRDKYGYRRIFALHIQQAAEPFCLGF